MKSDPVVILSARRTPVGAFQGAFASGHRPAARRGRDQGRRRRFRRDCRAKSTKSSWAACSRPALARRPRARPPWRAGLPDERADHHGQQNVRLRHARGHAGRRSDSCRHRQGGRRRRPRIHDQRTLSASQGARRLSHGPSGSAGSHVLRRTAESLGRTAHGLFRRSDLREVRIYPQGPGRFRRRVGAPRARRRQGGRISTRRLRRLRPRRARARWSSTRTKHPSRSTSPRFQPSSRRSKRTAR